MEFIREGGLEASRRKEKSHIEEERRRLRDEQFVTSRVKFRGTGLGDFDEGHISGIASARGLLKFLLD